MNTEHWATIPSANHAYSASCMGKIKNNKTGRILSLFKVTAGYPGCSIFKIQRIVHRLVAEAFLKNFSETMEVNHKNLIKDDNRVKNLEMVTHKNNMRHYYKTLPTHNCLRCEKIFTSRSENPKHCRLCMSYLWNVKPLKRTCKKCGHIWTQTAKKRTFQCKSCWTPYWE